MQSLDDKPVFADKKVAEQVIRRRFPEVREVRFVEHGYDNLVALVDDVYAFRFPRNKNAQGRNLFEAALLRTLEGVCPLPIPIILDEGSDPPYVATSFVHGQHLSGEEIATLSPEIAAQIGRELAAFMFSMHKGTSVDNVITLRARYHLDDFDDPWNIYLRQRVYDDTFPTAAQDALAKEYYAKWQSLADQPARVIHDDLHLDNILFQDGHVAGVLDFGGVYIGTAEQDMRQLYRLGGGILEACASEYERLSGQSISIEAAKIWSVVTELGAYSERLHAGQTDHLSFLRAQGHLQKWFPDIDWEVPRIKAIIFDCFGVLATDAWLPFKQAHFGHDATLFDTATELTHRVDVGQHSYNYFIDEVARLAGMESAAARAEIGANPPNLPLFDYIRGTLKPRYRIGLLSNASDDWLAELFNDQQLALLDAAVLSYQIKQTKPHPATYRAIAAKLGVEPGECLFVDDQVKYCQGAVAAGMRAIHYTEFEEFRSACDTIIADEEKHD